MAGSTTTAATGHKAHEDERYGLDPDLVTLARGVTSGYAPRGGVLLSPRIWQPFHRDGEQTPVFQHGATYAGHATAGALALRNIGILQEEKLVPRVAELDVLLTEELTRLCLREAVTDTRGTGLPGGVTPPAASAPKRAPTSSSSTGSSPARARQHRPDQDALHHHRRRTPPARRRPHHRHHRAGKQVIGMTSTTQLLTSDPAARAAAHEAAARIGGGRAGARGTIDVHDPSLLGTVTVSAPGAGRIETAYALLSDIITLHHRHADDYAAPTRPVLEETHRV
ncbi:aminotransferase class III-fold pyridoxal phosphate-dependent enzyme [Streptomyces sp. NPDC007991]|uniref:aminotransferase class III-fold pyridoxal phosphate-dependent enzyme n=1 Tax=Streptomyces sp. NPDC007991 TaxID=3364803 RepID=UPI0036EBDEAE